MYSMTMHMLGGERERSRVACLYVYMREGKVLKYPHTNKVTPDCDRTSDRSKESDQKLTYIAT